jgi:hypothetical protein
MDGDTILGLVLVVLALLAIGGLVAWSRWTINRIADKKLESARDIIRDLRNVS